ncbi:MAG: hypothetical protein KGJ82_11235 [Nitrospirota bacterium]|nr:hypothetical protein [Nitrospirota bacterium]
MKLVHSPLKQALLGAPIIADFQPWQTIVRAWVQSNGQSICCVGVPILKAWLQEHPGDAEAAQRLLQWQRQLAEQGQAA